MAENKTPKTTLPNYRWIKFEIEYLNDPDFMQLSEGAAGAYLKLYLLAGKADAGGLLCNSNKVFSPNDLAWCLRCSPDGISKHLEELTRARLLSADGDGYRLARFLEEQGPGDNEQRAKWRTRQDRSRARARGEPEPETEEEETLEREREQEAEEEEELESHGDNPVTPDNLPPPPSRASARTPSPETDGETFQNQWKGFAGRKLSKAQLKEAFQVIQEEDIEDWALRLRDCLSVWKVICKAHKEEGWQIGNPDAVMELYPIPNLEERMEREGITWHGEEKERNRKETLRELGLLEEED